MLKKDVYNLTNPQKNIYQVEQIIDEGSPINYITTVLKLDGNLDEQILNKTLNKIIEINDSLRLKFIEKDGEIVQYIEEYLPVKIPVVKLNQDDLTNFIEDYKKLKITLKNTFNFTIVLTPSCSFVFHKVHHIISDAWGMTQIAEQIKDIYTKIENNENLADLKKPSYLGLIERENKYLNSKKYDSDLEFWTDYVKNISSTKVFNNFDMFETKATRYEYVLDNDLFDKISQFCSLNSITEYSFFLGIIAIYFNKLFNQESIVIGTPFLNRQKRAGEFEATGLYVSTLPLNINVQKETDFINLCKTIGASNLALYKHSGFPYYKIQKIYNEYAGNTNRLYDIGFSYQINKLTNVTSTHDSGVCSWFFSGEQTQPLTIHVSTLNNYKVLFYDYLHSCFSKDEIEKTNKIILSLIMQVINNGITETRKLMPFTDYDIESLNTFNNTGNIQKNNLTVIDIFNNIVNTYPNNIAIVCGNNKITYLDLNKKINSLANYLVSIGIEPNKPIALLFDKSIEMIISMFAILKLGCSYVPILPDENKDRITYILNDCNPQCILTHNNYDAHLPITCTVVDVNKIDLLHNISDVYCNITPNTVAYIIYTSGSTGNPKGTMVTHKNISTLKESIENDFVLKATDKDISISLLKYSFDASGIDIYTALLFGGKLVLVPKEDELNPEKVIKIMEEQKVTRSFLIPKWIEHIAMQDELLNADLSSLKILGTGGEVLKPYIIENLLSKYANLKVLNLYGPTETTMFTTYKVVSLYEIKNNYTSIGKPIYGSRLAIINKFDEFMPIETEGELIVYEDENSIQNIAKGYLNLPEQTNKRFIKLYNPLLNKEVLAYKTGDVAKINKHLELEFMGRTDDVVKINGGYLVALNEVEKKISKTLGNEFEICPVAIPFQNTKIIVLFIKCKEQLISLNSIKKHINNNISFYMRPKKIIQIEEFPRNSSGKINRTELKKLAEKHMQEHKNKIIPPKTKKEKELYDIISTFVDNQDFSITDDFMDDLGIDSLTLTAIYTAIDNKQISIQDLYNNPNIRDLANLLDTNNSYEVTPDLTNLDMATISNNVNKFNLDTVLMTGVTGFLGIHIFHDLLLHPNVKKIYCIIRNKINLPGQKRLNKMIQFYFNSDPHILNLINSKVEILNGDTTKPFLGLDKKTYYKLQQEVTTVVNSAANVKHFVKPLQIRKDNVTSVNNLIEFCQDKISLAHVSTLSIAGFSNENTINKIFDENSLYIGQTFNNNPYLVSKFEAEKNILIATNKLKLNAIIFRLGNIMPRYCDGKFQENFSQNVFLSALNSIIKSGVIAKELNGLNIEFSPVDECAKMIMGILTDSPTNSIYHILSNKEISIFEFKTLLKYSNYNILDTDFKTFVEELSKNTDEYTKEYIMSNNLNTYSQKITLDKLESLGLTWGNIDLNYINKIINVLLMFE